MTRRGHRRILNRQRSQRRQFAAAELYQALNQRCDLLDETSDAALEPMEDTSLRAGELLCAA